MPKLVPGYRDEVKERILETAWKVIIRKGPHDITMDDFAAEMNCSKGALYNYFRNKDELIEEAISSGRTRFQDELFERFSDGDFFFNAEKYFDNEILNALGNMLMHLEILVEGARNEKLSAALKLKYDGAIESVVGLLTELKDKGRISVRFSIEESAKSLYSLRSGVLFGMVSGLSKDDGRKVWLNGLRCIISDGKNE